MGVANLIMGVANSIADHAKFNGMVGDRWLWMMRTATLVPQQKEREASGRCARNELFMWGSGGGGGSKLRDVRGRGGMCGTWGMWGHGDVGYLC